MVRWRPSAFALVSALVVTSGAAAEPVRVRFAEGSLHGFLALRTPDGKLVATGDNLQSVRGRTVTSRLLLQFVDGSTSDETAVFTQGKTFRLVSDRVVQKGPFFKMPMTMTVDGKTGVAVVKATKDGEEKTYEERIEVPDDLANGLLGVLLKNVSTTAPKTTLSMILATPNPRLVKLVITPVGKERFGIGRRRRPVMHLKIEIELGGLAGVIAPLIGKEPPDAHLWLLESEVPTFLMSEAPLALGTPALRMQLVGPSWPSAWLAPR